MYQYSQYIYPAISSLFTVIGFSIVGASIKQNKYRYLIFFLAMYFITIAISFIINDYFNSSFEMVIGIFGFIFSYSIIFKQKVLKSVSAFAIVYIVGMISETIFILVFGLFKIQAELILENVYLVLAVHFFTLFNMILCIYIKPLNSLLNRISKYSSAVIVFLINLIMFVLMLREVIDYITNERTTGLNTMIVFSLVILITGCIAIYVYSKQEKEIGALKRYSELKEEISPLIDYSIKQQHDFKNHLFALRELFCAENSEGVEYIDSLTKVLQENNEYLNWKNSILGALIQRKKQEAHDMDIKFTAYANYPDDQFPVQDHELISIISNLLDNAFTATSKLCPDKRMVEMTIGKEDKIFISVKNTCLIDSVNIKSIFKRGYTTKKDSRGLGLHIVKSISNKYNGNINVFPSNNELQIKISFDL